MRQLPALALALVLLSAGTACAVPLWETLLEDDFSGTSLNPALWNVRSNGGGSVVVSGGYADIISGAQDGGGTTLESRDSVDVAGCTYRLTIVCRPESPGVGRNDASHLGFFKWETTHDPDAWYPFTTSSFTFQVAAWPIDAEWYAEVANGQRGEQFRHQLGQTGWESERRYVIQVGGGTVTYFVDGTQVFRMACPPIPSGQFKIFMDKTSPGQDRHLYVDYVKLERSTSCVVPRPTIVFSSSRGGGGSLDVWAMAPNATALRRLTLTPDLDELWPRISPDGKSVLAVVRDGSLGSRGNGRLFQISADGSRSREILTNVANKSSAPAAWSSDGIRIVVGVHDGPDDEHHQLYSYRLLANGDGADPIALTNGSALDQADSPDAAGGLATFAGGGIGGRERIMVVDTAGSQTPLLDVGSGDPTINLIHPRWSPNAARIACTAEIPGGPNNLRLIEYPAGTETTIADALGEYAAFTSDDHLVYSSSSDGQSDLWTIDTSGGTPARLTNDIWQDMAPDYGLLVSSLISVERSGGEPAATVAAARPRSLQLVPNPSADKVEVRYSAPATRDASLTVYDVLGRQVRALPVPDGSRSASWDGRDGAGNRVSAGVYFIRLVAGKTRETARVTLLR